MDNSSISIVVPALQEEERIQSFLRMLGEARPKEIILVDGGSDDATVDLGRQEVDEVLVEPGGLAQQLNAGAAMPGVGCGRGPFPKCLLEMRER